MIHESKVLESMTLVLPDAKPTPYHLMEGRNNQHRKRVWIATKTCSQITCDIHLGECQPKIRLNYLTVRLLITIKSLLVKGLENYHSKNNQR